MLRVLTLTSRRVEGLSSPPAWTSIVQAISARLSRVNALFILQAKSDIPCEKFLYLTILPFLTVRGRIGERRFVFL